MYTRAAATPASASMRITVLSRTNSKSEKRSIWRAMKSPYSAGPVSSNFLWRTSTTIGHSARTKPASSLQARRVTASA